MRKYGMAKGKNGKSSAVNVTKRARISQTDVPAFSLAHALRVPKAIHENYGSQPTKPLDVARAMDLTPASSNFRQLTGAAIAFGLTEGGAKSSEITLTKLGKKIVSPLEEGSDLSAKKEAFLKPKIISEFLRKYDGYAIPRDDIAQNVVVEMGVPRERTERVLTLIIDGASELGLLSSIKGKTYVNLDATLQIEDAVQELIVDNELQADGDFLDKEDSSVSQELPPEVRREDIDENKMKRIFVTHGKNRKFVEPIKKLLAFGELEPVVSVEMQSTSEPVPDKVMNDMRSCAGAIIHVDYEQAPTDSQTNEHRVINSNVLIEIGAAMALYGRRFILLVREGIDLPSNLQGLYLVRYSDEVLDSDATIRLLEAIKILKTTPSVL